MVVHTSDPHRLRANVARDSAEIFVNARTDLSREERESFVGAEYDVRVSDVYVLGMGCGDPCGSPARLYLGCRALRALGEKLGWAIRPRAYARGYLLTGASRTGYGASLRYVP